MCETVLFMRCTKNNKHKYKSKSKSKTKSGTHSSPRLHRRFNVSCTETVVRGTSASGPMDSDLFMWKTCVTEDPSIQLSSFCAPS